MYALLTESLTLFTVFTYFSGFSRSHRQPSQKVERVMFAATKYCRYISLEVQLTKLNRKITTENWVSEKNIGI